MKNELFSIGSLTIYSYGFMIGLGIISALLMAEKRAIKKNLNENEIYSLGIIAVLTGFLGAKVLYCIVEFEYIRENPMEFFSTSGFVVYGGIIGGIIGAITYCRIKQLNFLKYFDLLMPSVALAQAFGRIGCLMAGCCYGAETESICRIVYYDSSFAPNNVALIPTQLYSSIGNLLLMFVLLVYASKIRADGQVGALYLILYSVGRFIIEIFRNDYRGEVLELFSTSQFISIFSFLFGIFLFIYFHRIKCHNKEEI